jgi:hypothetical protein
MIQAIMSALGGGLIEQVGNVVDRFVTTDAEKAALKLEAEKVILSHIQASEKSIQTEMEQKASIIRAEMESGDDYTRRARPSVVYVGLAAIVLNHVIAPWISHLSGAGVPEITLPTEFWWAWGGTVSVWFIGRSAERRGQQNKFITAITGGG